MEEQDRIDIRGPITEICHAFEIEPSYVIRIVIDVDAASVELLRGRHGRCQGPFYIDRKTGGLAEETLLFKVRT